MNITIYIYNMLQNYSIDPINMILTIGLRPPERLRVKTDRTTRPRVKITRTTSRVQHNRTTSL